MRLLGPVRDYVRSSTAGIPSRLAMEDGMEDEQVCACVPPAAPLAKLGPAAEGGAHCKKAWRPWRTWPPWPPWRPWRPWADLTGRAVVLTG